MLEWLTGKNKPENKIDMNSKTYHIAQGEVKLDSKKVEALSFGINEGYSDQDIVTIGEGVIQEINRAKNQLGKVA
jgi:hypothetical protein